MGDLVLLDNTVLANFALVEQGHLLTELWRRATTTEEVKAEFENGIATGRLNARTWPAVRLIAQSQQERRWAERLPARLGAGERSCLAVAFHHDALLATDDQTARKVARRFGITLTGTIGALATCVKQEILTLEHGNRLLEGMIGQDYHSPTTSLDELLRA